EEVTAPEPAPGVKVEAAGDATVYDVLGRDTSLIQAVQVPGRTLPDGLTLRPPSAGTSFQIATWCGDGACTDGIILDGVAWLRPALSADDREIISERGSWLERGVKIVYS